MTQIYLIRHGEAEGNVFRRFHGQYNSLLMPRGYEQRDYIQKRFENIPVDACFSSDLTRACLTAGSIYLPKGLNLQRDQRFREVHVGVWEDLPYGYLDTNYDRDMRAFTRDPVHWHVSGSETYTDYTDRFITAMEEAAKSYDGGTICIFCHGAVLRGVLMRLFFRDQPDEIPISDNAAVSHLFYNQGCFTYEYLNDNSHIPEQLSTYYIQSWWRKTDNRHEANLLFEPFKPEDQELLKEIPSWEEGGILMTGKLGVRPVGIISLGRQKESTGRILGMTLRQDMLGRYYADQLLGCAVSHFRRLGCTRLQASVGVYPEDVLHRYGFDASTLSRDINPDAFTF